MMYIKFILKQLKLFGMLILAFFIFPFIIYPRRKEIWAMRNDPKKKWYWQYSDTFETGFGNDYNNYINSTYGVYELVKKRNEEGKWIPDYARFETFGSLRKFFLAYHWLVFRNGCWNYIVSNPPKQGEWENVVCKKFISNSNTKSCKEWMNKFDIGIQSITWEVGNEKQFRYSFTKKAKWYNIQRLLTFFFNLFALKIVWHKYYNFMWGMSNNRYLVKTRTFNKEEN